MTQHRAGTEQCLQRELLQARRELLRWKLFARQGEERLREIETSLPWRIYNALRHLRAALAQRWQGLLLLLVLGVLLVPLAPLLLCMALLPAGRHLLWTWSDRLGPAGDLLQEIWSRLQGGAGPVAPAPTGAQPRVYRPSGLHADGATMAGADMAGEVLAQLTPQRRLLLARLQPGAAAPVGAGDEREHLSLHRSEASVLKVIAAAGADRQR